jgi:hypothetical protein
LVCVDLICGRVGINPSPIVRELQAILGERSKGIQLEAPFRMSLQRAIEYIDIDEYVEATRNHYVCVSAFWTQPLGSAPP